MSSVINAIQNVVATVVTILLLPTVVVVALVETAFGGSHSHIHSTLQHIQFVLHQKDSYCTHIPTCNQ